MSAETHRRFGLGLPPGSGTRQQLHGLALDRRWRIVESQPEPVPLDSRALAQGEPGR